MIPKRIDQITSDDIQSLIDNGVRESKTIEYKQELPGNTEKDKKEFLADISSFANASGGTVIYGIIEARDSNNKPTGTPQQAEGLGGINADSEVRRLEQILLSGLEPRIPGLAIRPVDGFSKGPVIVVQIPKSWSAPHMVTFQSSPRFFSRTSAGKSPLNVPEIRAAFLLSDEIPNKIRRFREERLGLISSGETPVPIQQGPIVVLHLVPLSAFLSPQLVDVSKIADGKVPPVPPLGAQGWDGRFNVDGYVSFQGDRPSGQEQLNYAQFFRNGIIEAVDAFILGRAGKASQPLIPSVSIEEKLLQGSRRYFSTYRELGIDSPIVIMLSLLNVKGFTMSVSVRDGDGHAIDKRHLLLPDVLVEDIHPDIEKVFHPVFDLLWQACGYRGSFNYDTNGCWKRGS